MAFRSGAWAKAADAPSTTRRGAILRRMRMVSSVELLELFERRCRRQRQVASVAVDDPLSFAAEDEAEEFAQPGLERLPRRAIEEDVDAARQRIRPVLERLPRRKHVGATLA